jgi:hypothetical protein
LARFFTHKVIVFLPFPRANGQKETHLTQMLRRTAPERTFVYRQLNFQQTKTIIFTHLVCFLGKKRPTGVPRLLKNRKPLASGLAKKRPAAHLTNSKMPRRVARHFVVKRFAD